MALVYTALAGSPGETVELLTTAQGTQLALVQDVPVGAPQRASVDTEGTQSTTDVAFVQCQTVAIVVASLGDYLIEWYAEFFSSDVAALLLAQVQLDGVSLAETSLVVADFSNTIPQSGFAIRTLGIGAHTVDMDFASDGSALASVRRRRITVSRIS
jgi:hypothetical protein